MKCSADYSRSDCLSCTFASGSLNANDFLSKSRPTSCLVASREIFSESAFCFLMRYSRFHISLSDPT
uniref:Uncharacterized protein n=1 Tax=Kalanchoe fedtschenkoi TaxID=63787 RepID=A0A7N0UZN2_KALFE